MRALIHLRVISRELLFDPSRRQVVTALMRSHYPSPGGVAPVADHADGLDQALLNQNPTEAPGASPRLFSRRRIYGLHYCVFDMLSDERVNLRSENRLCLIGAAP